MEGRFCSSFSREVTACESLGRQSQEKNHLANASREAMACLRRDLMPSLRDSPIDGVCSSDFVRGYTPVVAPQLAPCGGVPKDQIRDKPNFYTTPTF